VIKIRLETQLMELKGIGKKKADNLKRLGLRTIGDALNHYPRGYYDRGKVITIATMTEDDPGTIKAEVVTVANTKGHGRKDYLKLTVTDGTSNLEILYFNAGYLKNKFIEGEEYYFYGKLSRSGFYKQMTHSEFIKANGKGLKDFLSVRPVYGLTEGINQNDLIKIMDQVFKKNTFKVEETLPKEVVENHNLCTRDFAVRNIHFPSSREGYKISKYRLVFEELLNLQLGLLAIKKDYSVVEGTQFEDAFSYGEAFQKKLPFDLTGAQKRVWEEISADLVSPLAMNRLVQGDVGSGKTIIAIMGMIASAKNGYQSVMMAPTEILARQHYESISQILEDDGIKVELLTQGSKSPEGIERIKSGEADIVVGTHAVIEDNIEFANLGLVITDEQHRFGVRQRKKLEEKGNSPNVLIMTATPIPRTLSLVLYGDMNISVIDELPKGRKQIKTVHVTSKKERDMYQFIRDEIDKGRQTYMVYPLIEDSDKVDLKSAQSTFEELSKGELAGFKMALLHGKMKNREKEEIMNAFKEGLIDVLVSTTVIEVGINVPNASIMVIEHSERFGLAQLHQLRGRVGRGEYQSYCFLFSDSKGKVPLERIKMMTSTNDGFKIADKDLEIRGPGEFLGIRQHGVPELRIADLLKHGKILNVAQEEAKRLVAAGETDEEIRAFMNKLMMGFAI